MDDGCSDIAHNTGGQTRDLRGSDTIPLHMMWPLTPAGRFHSIELHLLPLQRGSISDWRQSSQALAAMRDLDPAGVTYGSIRVDIAMSAISSAIHNTGHYHVRPRPVCLSRSCFRSAKNRHSRSSCVLASLDLATRDTRAAAKEPASRLQRSCAEPAARVLGLIFSDRSLAKGRAGMAGADRRSNDGKKKGRNYRDTLPISAIPNSNCSAATLGLRPG
jgi:hypothetical protein